MNRIVCMAKKKKKSNKKQLIQRNCKYFLKQTSNQEIGMLVIIYNCHI